MSVIVGSPPDIVTTTHANTNVVEYVFTDNTGKATITIEGQSGTVATSGVDNDPQIANRQPLAADVPFEILLKSGTSRSGGPTRLYVACDVATDVTVVAERTE
jgi:hypothetical protein